MQIRLFVPRPLVLGETVALPDSQAHYLRNVLRASVGDSVYLFNGESGEFTGQIAVLDRKAASVSAVSRCIEHHHLSLHLRMAAFHFPSVVSGSQQVI